MDIFDNSNVFPFVFSFLPALVYSIIVYVTMPNGTIKWKTAFLYFLMGITSTFFVESFQFIFPQLHNPASDDDFLSMFILAMIQVSLVEEGAKLLCFKISESFINTNDAPHSTMFYAMSVSCGFAVSENLLYVRMYGSEILLARSFTSVVLHMLCGMILGYFISLGKKSRTKIKNVFPFIGLVIAVLYHGFYDFVLFVDDYEMDPNNDAMGDCISIVGIGIVAAYMMTRHLVEIYKSR